MPKNKRNLFSDFDDSLKERVTKKIIWKKIIFIAYEGVETEPKYFKHIAKYIKDNSEFNINLFPIDREKSDGKSHPKHVKAVLEEYFERKIKINFSKNDEYWIVIEKDRHIRNDKAYKEYLNDLYINKGKKNDLEIKAAVSNPSFEIWLILHYKNLEELELDKIKENKKVNSKKTYIKDYLKKILIHQISFDKNDYNTWLKLIQKAIKNAENPILAQSNEEMYNEIGTTIKEIMKKLF